MATTEGGSSITGTFGAAIAQAVFVVKSGANYVIASAQGSQPFGITEEAILAADFTAGKIETSIRELNGGGRARIGVNAAIAEGANITVGTDGLAETAATGDVILGTADEASTATGQFITMTIGPIGVVSA